MVLYSSGASREKRRRCQLDACVARPSLSGHGSVAAMATPLGGMTSTRSDDLFIYGMRA
jgi:hypothetical protein